MFTRRSRFRRKPRRRMGHRKSGWKGWVTTGLKFLRSVMNVEKKHFDLNNGSSDVTNAGTITSISDIAAGDDDGQRNGISVLAKSVLLRGIAAMGAATTTAQIRVVIFSDTQQNSGTDPAVTDVLAAAGVVSPLNPDQLGRFIILADKFIDLDPDGVATKTFTLFRRFPKKCNHIKFTGTAATNSFRNQVYVMTISTAGANYPTLTWYSRIAYYDN